ncbi:MAG: hypothetical protein LBT16_00665 [Treponema sp.]|jgi:hypothetical protein|nr:hypothetical protein [Treponema sp.]
MDARKKEELIQGAVAEFEAGLRAKADEFQATDDERELNINVIEALWGESRKLSDKILKRVYTELANNSGGDELILEKKQR